MKTSKRVFGFFRRYHRVNGFSPTIREIMAGVDGLNSTSAVDYHLRSLAKKSLLKKVDGKSLRCYVPVKAKTAHVRRKPMQRRYLPTPIFEPMWKRPQPATQNASVMV